MVLFFGFFNGFPLTYFSCKKRAGPEKNKNPVFSFHYVAVTGPQKDGRQKNSDMPNDLFDLSPNFYPWVRRS